MDIEQALHSFWTQFGTAYEETSIPDNANLKEGYITYQKVFGNYLSPVFITGSICTRATSWATADRILNSINEALKDGGQIIKFDGGRIYFTKGSPFAQPMEEEDHTIKRYIVNISANYFTK